jgi:hypothetical protein
VLAVRGRDSSGRFFVNELAIPGRITIYPMEAEAVRGRKILRMVRSPGFLTRKDLYRISIILKKFKHENVTKMKNKPDPALLRPSNLSNKIKKGYQNLVRLSL